jgi:hypothetical protein
MKCKTVLKQLSWFIDDVMDHDEADGILRHMHQCSACRREFKRLVELRRKLGSLENVVPPDYLKHLIELRLNMTVRETWRERLRNVWEYGWSKIRTTEGMWYLTRLLGTATTVLFFFMISSSMNPLYLSFDQRQSPERAALYQTFREMLLRNLGITVGTQSRRATPSEPQINDLYYLSFGENASRAGNDDSLAVAAVVDSSGTAKIQNVLEYPADSALLAEFNSMLTSARCRPAIQNGRAVNGHLVLAFNKITVYD